VNVEQLRRLVGRRVVDDDGRSLGEIVGITHHADGDASLLVSGGPWPWSDGRHVSVEGALLDEDGVRLPRTLPPWPVLTGLRNT
jgi:hypothetical protein